MLPLPGVRPRRGDLVAQRGGALTDLWRVRRIAGGVATCARPEGTAAGDLWEFPVDGLIVVRQFGEPIFPALVPLGSTIPSFFKYYINILRKSTVAKCQ